MASYLLLLYIYIYIYIHDIYIRHVLPRYYTFRPNMFKFSSLLSSEEPSVLRKLAKILYLRDS